MTRNSTLCAATAAAAVVRWMMGLPFFPYSRGEGELWRSGMRSEGASSRLSHSKSAPVPPVSQFMQRRSSARTREVFYCCVIVFHPPSQVGFRGAISGHSGSEMQREKSYRVRILEAHFCKHDPRWARDWLVRSFPQLALEGRPLDHRRWMETCVCNSFLPEAL